MARIRQARTTEEVKRITVGKLRKEYNLLAEEYNRIIEQRVLLCPKCNEYKLTIEDGKREFYKDTRWATGYFPICKDCLKLMAEQRKDHRTPANETKESVQTVLRIMDRPYIDKLYVQCVENVRDNNSNVGIFEENPSAFANYIRCISSLPQYRNKKGWDDSEFGLEGSTEKDFEEEIKIEKETIESGKKRFGRIFSEEDLMFLETEYQDWTSRYECNTKAQEKVFRILSLIELQRTNAIKKGQPTKDLDKAYQDWLDTGNLKPKQNSMDAFSDAQTLGTLIQKYEEERPLPTIDSELEDVDKIGLYIDVFFKGHLCKVLNIKNRFSNIYENFMQKFTVKPPEFNEDEDSEAIFDKIFGGIEDG